MPLAAIDTAQVRRLLDEIATEGQRNQVLVLFKSLQSFARSRGLADTQPIAIVAGKSREIQNFYSAAELRRLDAALVTLIHEQPGWLLSFAAVRRAPRDRRAARRNPVAAVD